MGDQTYRPGSPLDQCVQSFWHWDGHDAPATRERVIPTGALTLVIHLGDDHFTVYDGDGFTPRAVLRGPVVSGAHAGFFVLGDAPSTPVMGVNFRPGGAFPFLGVPASDLRGTHAPLDALWGADASRLRDRLREAATADARFVLLESLLLSRASRPLARHAVLASALRAFEEPGLASVAALCDRLGCSPRRLIALFGEQVGLGPKTYWRIRRFQAALRAMDSLPDQPGSERALALGYFDQPHLNRDFREFTGLSPRAYRAHGTLRPHHVAFAG